MAGRERRKAGATLPDPVFVGGSGRSGTHVMARLLGRHSRYRYISSEIRFHTDRGGLCDLLAGRVSLRRFGRHMRGYWWDRPSADGRPRGLHRRVPPDVYEKALAAFESSFAEDPLPAARSLIRSLLDPLAEADGKPSWVEQTPQNVAAAPTLLLLFPDARFVHMIRDGRDAACSLVTRPWGPGALRGGVKRWAERLRKADAGAAAAPADRILLVRLEELVELDRERSYERVRDFLRLEDEPVAREYFERKVTSEHAHIGRWRRELSEREQAKLNRLYARAVDGLIRDGVAAAEPLAKELAEAPVRRTTRAS